MMIYELWGCSAVAALPLPLPPTSLPPLHPLHRVLAETPLAMQAARHVAAVHAVCAVRPALHRQAAAALGAALVSLTAACAPLPTAATDLTVGREVFEANCGACLATPALHQTN